LYHARCCRVRRIHDEHATGPGGYCQPVPVHANGPTGRWQRDLTYLSKFRPVGHQAIIPKDPTDAAVTAESHIGDVVRVLDPGHRLYGHFVDILPDIE
jgi:hypothetical protein